MINYNEFEEKVQSISAHDIIMSMVNGLRNPKTLIDMGTYGKMREGICFGCAATNAILNIMNANEEEVKSYVTYGPIHDGDLPLYGFEYAIDRLRCGKVEDYNALAKRRGLAQIVPIPGQDLPLLGNDYTEEQLKEYEKLAKYQLIK